MTAPVCDYCHAVGACPKCWGRAAIAEKDAEIARLRSLPPPSTPMPAPEAKTAESEHGYIVRHKASGAWAPCAYPSRVMAEEARAKRFPPDDWETVPATITAEPAPVEPEETQPTPTQRKP